MTDIRKISVEITTTQDFEVDVDDWFLEFQKEWLEYANEDGLMTDELREEFIKETAFELAADGSLGYPVFEEINYDVEIWRQ